MTLRVFVDTSVLFSGLHSASGAARDVLAAAARADLHLVVSSYVLGEVRRNLAEKSAVGSARLSIVIATGDLTLIDPDEGMIERVRELVDPKDAPVVAAAVVARVPIIATYDQRHLLSRAEEIRAAFGVEVLTPRDVLDRMAADG